jgi:hypothetical protein|tara:strand:+ start:512 stop:799 length:288 start_codon:yes stop_codon:yes gene_type:complete
MPKLLFDFKCEEGHVTSEFIDTSIKNISCDCGKPAKRLISSPHFPLRQGLDLDMTTAADRWARVQRAKNSGKMTDLNNDRYDGPRSQDTLHRWEY